MAKKKTLKSQFHGSSWISYPTVVLPIKELWASVPRADTHKGKPFYSRLAKDIAENGLHYPLLVVHATRRELIERKNICTDELCELPFDETKTGELNKRLYVIWGGSNRVRVAEELGFTHVDCVVIESFDKAYSLQRDHRKPYTQKYYTPPRPRTLQFTLDEITTVRKPVASGPDASIWDQSLPKVREALFQPEPMTGHWVNYGVCMEARGEHLQAAMAFMKAHELDPDRRSTYINILRNLYFARDFDRLVDFTKYCKHCHIQIPAFFAKDPFFAELFAHEPFKTIADLEYVLPIDEAAAAQANDENGDTQSAEPQEPTRAYEDMMRDESTLPILKDAAEKNPNNEVAWFNYGVGLKLQARYNEAAEAFIRVQELNPQNETIYPLIFRCLFRADNQEMLLGFATYCTELSPDIIAVIASEPVYNELFKQPAYRQLLTPAARKETEAPASKPVRNESELAALRETVAKTPTNDLAWFDYGTCLLDLGRYEEATDAFTKAQDLNPGNRAVYPAMFRCFFQTDNQYMLLNFANYCAGLNPEIIVSIAQDPSYADLFRQPEFSQLLGQHTIPQPEPQPAQNNTNSIMQEFRHLIESNSLLPMLRNAVEKNPTDESAWFTYGSALQAMGLHGEAAEAFIKAQELNPGNDAVYPAVFQCLHAQGDLDMMLNFAAYCRELNPEIVVNISKDPAFADLFNRTEFNSLLTQHPAQTASAPEAASVEKPASGNLMQEYEALLNNDAMFAILKDAVDKNPADDIAWLNYGTGLLALKRYDEATEALFKAQELNPGSDAVYPVIFKCLCAADNLELLLNFAQYCNELSPQIIQTVSRDAALSDLFTIPEFKALLGQSPALPEAPALLTPSERPKKMNKTFITGTDASQEWMLKWWYRNITTHNPDIHITICDFGDMSPEVRAWARAHADHFIQYPKRDKCAWFYKTQAMIDSPYEYTCWMDIDCQVLKPISEMFNYAQADKIGLTSDTMHSRRTPDEHWWATGVNLIKGTSKLLLDWHKLAENEDVRGDQEALHLMLQRAPDRAEEIMELPIEYQWLRLQLARNQDSKEKKVVHWTGPRGKEHIRNHLMTQADVNFSFRKTVPQPELLCAS
ncbi:MAG: tetratricopeptide repeat protein [Pontiellaceae bacterium]|nr:tetratricopeptide repeat protein [Pontiellaceae bacterium]MBN2784159.1 tetratricopeptide repeat protein [Pontiellaceae bacterium]